MPPITTNNATGLFGSSFLPRMSTASAAPPSRSDVRLVSSDVPEELPMRLPEITVRAVDAKQLRQLRAGEKQRHAALEADHHAFGDEVYDRAGAAPARR